MITELSESRVGSTPRWGSGRRWFRAMAAGLLSAAAIGVPTKMIGNPWFSRMTPVRWWDYQLLAATAGLTALRFAIPGGASSGACRVSGGSLLSTVAVGCPVSGHDLAPHRGPTRENQSAAEACLAGQTAHLVPRPPRGTTGKDHPPRGRAARLSPVLEIAARHAHDVDAEARYPTQTVAALRESGLFGLTVPTETGGLGGGPHELIDTVGALAGVCGSSAMIYLMHVSTDMPVAITPPAGLPTLLNQLADGSTLGSLAFSDAGSRSHFWTSVSRATLTGDTVHLTARNSWVTSAGYADLYIVSTGTPDLEGGGDLRRPV